MATSVGAAASSPSCLSSLSRRQRRILDGGGRKLDKYGQFRMEVRESKAACVIVFYGELDNAGVEEAENVVRTMAGRRRSVTLDLRALEFIESAGIALLIRMDALARQDGFNLFITKGSAAVQRVIGLCGLDDRFEEIDAPEDLNV